MSDKKVRLDLNYCELGKKPLQLSVAFGIVTFILGVLYLSKKLRLFLILNWRYQ